MSINNPVRLYNIKGILFDVDGTLYHQAPLRAIMIFLLFLMNITSPKELIKKIRVIYKYRKAQEILRSSDQGLKDCSKRQIDLAAKITGESSADISKIITEWFINRPLPYLRFCRRKGVDSFVDLLHKKGFKLGVFSDYPAEEKLNAMGIKKYFSTIVSGSDTEVTGFKPNTNGFTISAGRMGLDPSEVLYIGDRAGVDGAGATEAGMPVVILKSFFKKRVTGDYLYVNYLFNVLKVLDLDKGTKPKQFLGEMLF